MRCACGRQVNQIFSLDHITYCQFCQNQRIPKCYLCKEALTDETLIHNNRYYHKACYQRIALRCAVCQQIINSQYFETYFGAVCEKCNQPNLRCHACDKQLNQKTALFLPDHRPVCQTCYSKAAFHLDENLIKMVIAILLRFKVKIQKPVIYATVDINTLMRFKNGITNHTIFGQCKTNSIVYHNGQSEVTDHQIFILYGLPGEYVVGILGHELFHAWLNENTPPNVFSRDDVEWLCDFIAWHLLKETNCDKIWQNKFQHSLESSRANIKFLFSQLKSPTPQQITQIIKQLAH